jgi:DNA-directed RNA polymerase subunit E'/Rpb7
MNCINLIKEVSISPRNLDCNLNQHILEKARKIYVGTSNKQDGCIINIHKINTIIDNYVDTNTIFTVDMTIDIIKPQIGDILTSTIAMIFDSGIFLTISDIKIMIPSSNLLGGIFNRNNNTYKVGKYVYKIGDEIKVKIEQIRYLRHQFSCIASISI